MNETPQQAYEKRSYQSGLRQYKRRIPKEWFKKVDDFIKRLGGEI